jgi:hypothetical protein
VGIIDRYLPPDPQLEFSHGQDLRLLLDARRFRALKVQELRTGHFIRKKFEPVRDKWGMNGVCCPVIL